MLFSSLEFIYLFSLITIPLYFLCPLKYRNIVLLVSSLIFYGWGEPVYLFLMVFTIIADWFIGLRISSCGNNNAKKWLVFAVVLNLGLLGFFKYASFFVSVFASAFPSLGVKVPSISLPIGISFYTFQAMSYVIDVYRNDAEAQKDPLTFGTYVTLFPQLIAGPIVRYRDVDQQLTNREHSFPIFASGMRVFICGLCKKVLLGNTAAEMWSYCAALPADERTLASSWLGIICFSFHIYYDFSGYSDMAIGLGRMFGFRFLENFYYPYTADSITDFWRRWHISLSTWFREYVYIPLGGNRCSVPRQIFNLCVVWFLTGFWHGAGWNFILWGVYYALLLILEKFVFGKLLQKLPKVLKHIYALFFIVIGWLIFAFDGSEEYLTLSSGIGYLSSMFGSSPIICDTDIWDITRFILPLTVMTLGCLPVCKKVFWKLNEKSAVCRTVSAFSAVALFLLCTAYLVDSSFNPFIYSRF